MVPILALPHARWCKRIAGQRVAVAADVYWKVERACRLERQRRYFDTAPKSRRSENKKGRWIFHRPATLSPPGLRRAVMTFAAVLLALVVGVLAVVFLHLEGVELVVWRAVYVGVAASPIHRPIHDRGAGINRAATGEPPEDVATLSIQSVHSAHCIQSPGKYDAIGKTHHAGGYGDCILRRTCVRQRWRLIAGHLPEDLACCRIQPAPETSLDNATSLWADRECERRKTAVGDRDVNPTAVHCRTPFKASQSAARTGLGGPHGVSGIRVKRPIDPALLAGP